MLKPAILFKDEIEKKIAEHLYTDEFFYYSGYAGGNTFSEIKTEDNRYQWAIIEEREKIVNLNQIETKEIVIGYFAYYIDFPTDSVSNFGLFSFDPGNPLIGFDVFHKMKELIMEHRRIEWRMVSGNHIKRSYDKLCQRYKGRCVRLYDVIKDIHGNWHDEYIYEIIWSEDKYIDKE